MDFLRVIEYGDKDAGLTEQPFGVGHSDRE